MFIVRWNGLFSSVPGTSLVARNVTPTRVQARLDRNRAASRSPLPVVFGDLLVPVEQLHALAVDRDFELLALDVAEHRL